MARFLLGFAVGAAASTAIVVFTAPRSGTAQRREVRTLWDGAKEAARAASDTRTQELWADYRSRLGQA